MASTLALSDGANPPFVAYSGVVAAFLQHGLERVKNFCAPLQRFRKSFRAHRHGHEFLEIDIAISMRATIENVHHGYRQNAGTHAPR